MQTIKVGDKVQFKSNIRELMLEHFGSVGFEALECDKEILELKGKTGVVILLADENITIVDFSRPDGYHDLTDTTFLEKVS